MQFFALHCRMMVLTDAQNCTTVSSFVWTKLRNVTEGQTDRRTDWYPLAITVIDIASNADALAELAQTLACSLVLSRIDYSRNSDTWHSKQHQTIITINTEQCSLECAPSAKIIQW